MRVCEEKCVCVELKLENIERQKNKEKKKIGETTIDDRYQKQNLKRVRMRMKKKKEERGGGQVHQGHILQCEEETEREREDEEGKKERKQWL